MVPQEVMLQISELISLLPVWVKVTLLLLAVWSLIWKGLALWKSARLNQPLWFLLLLVVNTMGILEILYIYVFSNLGFDHLSSKKSKKSKK
jgi:MFS superfamily sulfate permease-like transporter